VKAHVPGEKFQKGPLGAFWTDVTEVTRSRLPALLNAQSGQAESGVAWLERGKWTDAAAGPHSIPGRIEAEDYDIGGEYRQEDVGIEGTSDLEGGHNTGWTEEGEWLAYTVDVACTGLYDIHVRVASAMYKTVTETLPVLGKVSWAVPLTRTLHIEIDDKDVSGLVTFVSTGGWQSWTLAFAHRVQLTEGQHVLRIVTDSGGINLNRISFAASCPPDEPPEELIDGLIAAMIGGEMVDQLHGTDWVDTADNIRVWIPSLRMSDGPHGLRDALATSFPVGITMAVIWAPDLIEGVGTAMGNEF
jgi:hypothetical protein